MAKGAGVRAIEGAFHSFTKGCLFRVLNQHCRPGDRLKGDPVQTDCETERNYSGNPAQNEKHVGRLPSHFRLRQIIYRNWHQFAVSWTRFSKKAICDVYFRAG